MDINDILGLGKMLPVDKLLDMLSKAFGVATKPYFDRRDIDTKAYEIEKLTDARIDSMKKITDAIRESSSGVGGINYSESGMTIESFKQTQEQYVQTLPIPALEDRTHSRINYQEAKRQLNIESVSSFAAEDLKNEPPVTNEPVDEGWTTRFFRYAEDISDEGMQAIWGKILAGEIKQPKTYSLRALEILRNLSKYEADIFVKAADFAIEVANEVLLFKGTNRELEQYGLGFTELSVLRETGILHEGEFTSYKLLKSDVPVQTPFNSSNLLVLVDRKPSQSEKPLQVYVFTQVGRQLLKLIKSKPNIEYLNLFAANIQDDDTIVRYAYILKIENGLIHHTQPLLEFPIK